MSDVLNQLAAVLEERKARLAELIRGPRSEKIVAARANLEGARHDLELRVIEYERAEKLLMQKLTSPANRDRARAALDAATAAVEFNDFITASSDVGNGEDNFFDCLAGFDRVRRDKTVQVDRGIAFGKG